MRRYLFSLLAGGVLTLAAAAASPEDGAGAVVDDFEDGDLVAATGSAWIPLADDLMGGATTIRLEPTKHGAHGSRGALRLSAVLADNLGSFAAAWTPIAAGARTSDISRFAGLRLRLRGSGEVLVGVRAGNMASAVNFMGRVKAERDWTSVTLPFSSLVAQGKGHESDRMDPAQSQWLGVGSPPGVTGPFEVEIDDVAWVDGDASGAAPSPNSGAPMMLRRLIADDAAPLKSLPWRALAKDGAADGRGGLPDARALLAAPDAARRLVWFRIDLEGALPPNWIGVNVAFDLDGDPGNGVAWWGKNTAFHFDRLATAWVFKVDDHYEGTVGIAESAEASGMLLTNDREVHLALDRRLKRVYLGIPAADAAVDTARVVAAVGSAFLFADDLPNEGAAALRH